MKPRKAKRILREALQNLTESKLLFSADPKKDFTRKRKLSFEQMLKAILCIGGSSLANKMLDLFGFHENLATTSAFVQQRAKILPEAFESLFDMFVRQTAEQDTYRGYQLLAVDGSDFLTAANPDDPDSFFPGTEEQKPYNLIHLNALYDLVRHVYVNALLQKRRCEDECDALVRMVDRSDLRNVLLTADRGYESYNVLAHIQEKGWKFLIRVKNGAGGIAGGLDLPTTSVFDLPISLNLTNRQTNEVKRLFQDKNHYKFLPNKSRFDFLPSFSLQKG